MSFFSDIGDFFGDIVDKFRGENEERRREDRALDDEMEVNEVQESPRILKVNLRPKENSLRHHCDRYELVTRGKGECIVRRGGTVIFDVELNQDVDVKTSQKLRIYFNFGPRPLVNKGTRAVLSVSGKKSFDKSDEDWDQRVVETEGAKLVLEIQIPHDAPVGAWNMSMDVRATSDEEGTNRHLKRLDSAVYILFNPWNKSDDVYLKNEEEREEYVLNDVGKIWVGGYPTPRGRQWVFGQYDDAVLPACVILMEKSGLLPEQRESPVLVSRAISRMVNSNDDQGVLIGRWDEKYADGTAPTSWTGSIKIMEQYLRKGTPVKYGQCWVFSGVVTTVCRALGLPCRSVSNQNSAHDTNMSLTIDKYYQDDGEKFVPDGADSAPDGIGDSIWNFHVWNDVWMARPDLPAGFGGWQAIDSTPQERSGGGSFQCGPASLEAVRTGQTNHNYDVNFVMAEVNADLIRWQKSDTEEDGFKKVSSNKRHVGRQLLTKAVGEFDDDPYLMKDRHDCTKDYKEREGSKAERVALQLAAHKSRNARHAFRFPSTVEEDVEFTLDDVVEVPIGEDFAITLNLKNKSESSRSVFLVLSASSEYYTGIKSKTIKKAEGLFKVEAGESTNLKLSADYKSYFDKLVEYGMVKIVAIANVKETSQTWIGEDTFQVIKPAIDIKVEEPVVVGKPIALEFSFKNPLDILLEKCSLVVDGPGLTRPKTIPVRAVSANEEMKYRLKIKPSKVGRRTLVATFNSTQLVDLTGSKQLNVVEKAE